MNEIPLSHDSYLSPFNSYNPSLFYNNSLHSIKIGRFVTSSRNLKINSPSLPLLPPHCSNNIFNLYWRHYNNLCLFPRSHPPIKNNPRHLPDKNSLFSISCHFPSPYFNSLPLQPDSPLANKHQNSLTIPNLPSHTHRSTYTSPPTCNNNHRKSYNA